MEGGWPGRCCSAARLLVLPPGPREGHSPGPNWQRSFRARAVRTPRGLAEGGGAASRAGYLNPARASRAPVQAPQPSAERPMPSLPHPALGRSWLPVSFCKCDRCRARRPRPRRAGPGTGRGSRGGGDRRSLLQCPDGDGRAGRGRRERPSAARVVAVCCAPSASGTRGAAASRVPRLPPRGATGGAVAGQGRRGPPCAPRSSGKHSTKEATWA